VPWRTAFRAMRSSDSARAARRWGWAAPVLERVIAQGTLGLERQYVVCPGHRRTLLAVGSAAGRGLGPSAFLTLRSGWLAGLYAPETVAPCWCRTLVPLFVAEQRCRSRPRSTGPRPKQDCFDPRPCAHTLHAWRTWRGRWQGAPPGESITKLGTEIHGLRAHPSDLERAQTRRFLVLENGLQSRTLGPGVFTAGLPRVQARVS